MLHCISLKSVLEIQDISQKDSYTKETFNNKDISYKQRKVNSINEDN